MLETDIHFPQKYLNIFGIPLTTKLRRLKRLNTCLMDGNTTNNSRIDNLINPPLQTLKLSMKRVESFDELEFKVGKPFLVHFPRDSATNRWVRRRVSYLNFVSFLGSILLN